MAKKFVAVVAGVMVLVLLLFAFPHQPAEAQPYPDWWHSDWQC